MREARYIADKLVWQRFEVNEVFWTGPFGVNMLYTIANHFEYVRMVTITPLPVQINPWTITRGKPYWKQVWRKDVEALAIEPPGGTCSHSAEPCSLPCACEAQGEHACVSLSASVTRCVCPVLNMD